MGTAWEIGDRGLWGLGCPQVGGSELGLQVRTKEPSPRPPPKVRGKMDSRSSPLGRPEP